MNDIEQMADIEAEDSTIELLPSISFEFYQVNAAASSVYPPEVAIEYLTLGLMNEAGEVGGKVKKYIRGDYDIHEMRDMVAGELGDVLWYLTVLAHELEIPLEMIAQDNLEKLADRLARGVIQGDGDNR